MFYSPLRYPGGKYKLAKFISQICELNNIHGHYIEPYAGGASVALFLLLEGKVAKITINDIDRSIYAFWHSILKHTNKFCALIESTEINLENWHRAKEIQKRKDTASLLELGLSTFYLNRTNVSGTLNAGVIGGQKQSGDYKIDCRFNKTELIKKIKKIASRKKDITVYNLDAIKLVNKIQSEPINPQTIFYFDPPYYLKGQSLYLNHYKHEDHENVSETIQKIKNVHWIVSYDNTPEIKNLYRSTKRKKEYSLGYTAHGVKTGDEVLFFSNRLVVPRIADPIKA